MTREFISEPFTSQVLTSGEQIFGYQYRRKNRTAYRYKDFVLYNAMLFVTSIFIGWRLNFDGINSTVDANGETTQAQT